MVRVVGLYWDTRIRDWNVVLVVGGLWDRLAMSAAQEL